MDGATIQYDEETFCDCASEAWEDNCCTRCGREIESTATSRKEKQK